MAIKSLFPAFRKLALLLALGAHLLAPAASAATPGIDTASMLCAPSGKISPEAKAAIEEMLRLAGGGAQDDEPPSMSGHCGACVMVGGALAPGVANVFISNSRETHLAAFARARQTVPAVHGPPLGLRAPPDDFNAS